MLLKREYISYLMAVIIMIALSGACTRIEPDFTVGIPEDIPARPSREQNNDHLNVFLIYSAGYNNLSSALKLDIEEFIENTPTIPDRNVLLVYSHSTHKYNDYRTPTSPILMRIFKEDDGTTVRDTLKIFPEGTNSASAETVKETLTYIRDNFQASVYGMLLSSHGTGWIPEGYMSNSNKLEGWGSDSDFEWQSSRRLQAYPYIEHHGGPDKPAVKAIGAQNTQYSTCYEIDIKDFADAIPMKLDYLIFDACLMGGIEVAYQLRGKCDWLIASPAEILSDGMDYISMPRLVLGSKWPDYEGLCAAYYDHYKNQEFTTYRSATISLIDCNNLEQLAEICREIFSSNRDGIAALEGARNNQVQMYFTEDSRKTHQWFYDLESIVHNCGATQQQKDRLHKALQDCVPYKKHTEMLLGYTPIKHYSGLNMYLPFKSRNYLNSYYKTLEWNKATGLVE